MSKSTTFFDSRTIFIICSLLFVFGYIVVSSFLCNGWVYASLLAIGVWVILVGYALYTKDKMLLHFIALATVAGFTELIADNWLVNGIDKLTYHVDEPHLVASPLYMPFAWAVVLTQIGYIGWKLIHRWGLIKACLFTGVLGGLIIPVYEHCAKGACWWTYHDWNHEWFNTPYFIILGEALLMLLVPFAMQKVVQKNYLTALVWGIICGLWIWVSYFIGYVIVG